MNNEKSRVVTNWEKFTLLLWKNWKLQWNRANIFQLILQLGVPVLFAMLLVLVRAVVDVEEKPMKGYNKQEISDLSLFKNYTKRARVMQEVQRAFQNSKTMRGSASLPDFKLAYSPENQYLDAIITEAVETLGLAGREAYPNASALERVLAPGSYIAGVQFEDSMADLKDYPRKFKFSLRFPAQLRTSTSNIPFNWMTNKLFPIIDITGPRNAEQEDGGIPVGYLREGFLPIQHAVSMAYIKLAGNVDTLPTVSMQRYPYPEYIFDPLLEGLSSIITLIIILSFIYPCIYITKSITSEKEKQLKEIMKIMGLNNWLHWTAWFVKSFIMLGVSAILMAMLMKLRWGSAGVSVLSHSSFTALLLFLFIYLIASICFCFMIATFFSKASTAAAVTGLVWFIAYLPFSFTIQTYDSLSLGDKLGWSLISNTAVGFGFKVILEWEGTGEGLQWSNLFSPVSVDDNLSLGAIMLMLLAASVLYMIVCLYVEQVMPGNFGIPQKWYFPFTRKFWCGTNEYVGIEDLSKDDVHQKNPDAFEAEPAGKHVGLQVKNLKKKFGDKMAVRGLSVNMYEDEITVLLGHNGAGKTTTISMLTGMFPPTAGTAIINGSDIRTNIDGARQSLGVCPQHNVLFDELSVANHIVFFSRLKGLKGAEIKSEVDKYLKMIELEDKANVQSKKLSGGMKRKLSVCCALCGGTKVVMCDEPSSGMDPAARRQLWDLLQAEKLGRTMLLTTHFMDEADVLGDRIAIMCNGELKCHGTSFFLKKKYGSGYRLICVKRDGCSQNEVTALLQEYVPDIKPESDIGAELSYQLPDQFSSVFEKMLQALEAESENLKLGGYGVGITSMEEVFMKVGSENAANGTKKEYSAIMNGATGYGDDDVESMQSDQIFSEHSRLLKGKALFLNQWHAMFIKKYLYTLRNKLMFAIQLLIPVFFIIMTILISRSTGPFREMPPMAMSLTQYPTVTTVLETARNVAAGSLEEKISAQYEKSVLSHGPDYMLSKPAAGQNFTDYILKLGATLQVRINSRYLAAATVERNHITAWLNNQPLHTAPLTVNLVHNAIAKAVMGEDVQITVINEPLKFTPEARLQQLNTGANLGTQLATNICFCMCFVAAFYILFVIKERETRSKLLQFVAGVRVWTFWLTQFLWDYMTFALTALIAILTIACFQEDGFSSFVDLGRYFAILLLFGCAMLPFTYLLSYLFNEPASGFALLSIISIFSGMALFIVVVVMSFEFFDTKELADTLQWFFRIFPHFSLAMSLNKVYINWATRNTCNNELIVLLPDSLRCQLVPRCCSFPGYFSSEEPGILWETIYMVGTAIIFFLIIICFEYGIVSEIVFRLRSSCCKRKQPGTSGTVNSSYDDEDEDVASEKERILKMSNNELETQNLVLDRVTKYYGNFLAVNQVSLCVKSNECFGLLGVNGAGKTTTFKMMTGDERITNGAAYIRGMSLATEMSRIYQEIGYCPQFDALLDDLTGRETMLIFCLVRGVRRERISALSEELAKSFGFMKHIDKQTKAYSGGNKRKLSTAIAVIGSPTVIYLDEPTTGMDPASRRQLWNMVCRIRDSGKSLVLTSHSMEECEALCTRLAIMVNGEFKCIGSTQYLKNKFSKGLILKMKVKRMTEPAKSSATSVRSSQSVRSDSTNKMHQDVARVKEFVEQKFPESMLQEEYQGMLTFYIPLSSIKWSEIFGLMERNREQLNIEDYSISQTTLEEIFLDFAKYQREDARPVKAKKKCWNYSDCCVK